MKLLACNRTNNNYFTNSKQSNKKNNVAKCHREKIKINSKQQSKNCFNLNLANFSNLNLTNF